MEEVCWKCAIDLFVWTWELRPRSWRRETDNKKRTSLTTRDYRGFNHLIRINSHLIRMTAFFWEEGSGKIYQSNLSGIICRNNLSGIVIPKAASCIFMKRLCWAVDEWGMLWWHTFQHLSLIISFYTSNDCARWRKCSLGRALCIKFKMLAALAALRFWGKTVAHTEKVLTHTHTHTHTQLFTN